VADRILAEAKASPSAPTNHTVSGGALKLAGARMLIPEAPITERRHEFETPQDASSRNFIPQRDFTRYCKTRLLVRRNNSMPEALLADFAPLGGAWRCFRLRLRLEGG
jgi:hypothetical protein